jgi:Ca2+-dependent lipid-binding protein
VFLYLARDIPPADESGTSDSFVKIRCSGKTVYSSIKLKTLNPVWYETLVLEVELPDFDDDNI